MRLVRVAPLFVSHFFYHATPTSQIYTLSLHDALPISLKSDLEGLPQVARWKEYPPLSPRYDEALTGGKPKTFSASESEDRKSTRLNSSHVAISYAVFCLKKKIGNRNRVVYKCSIGRCR